MCRALTSAGFLLLLVMTLSQTRAAGQTTCPGDCNGDGVVTVDEVILMVNVALGSAAVSTCEAGDVNGDGQITVDDILAAVNSALNACPGGMPTNTPTPLPTSANTATPTVGLSGTVLKG